MIKNDLAEDIKRQASSIDIEDEKSDAEFELTKLKLKREKTRVKLDLVLLEQERLRLERIKKNNDRRPMLWGIGVCMIVLLYLLFFITVFSDLMGNAVNGYGRTAEIAMVAIVPTILLAFLMKAIFSSQKKEDGNEIKVADVVPMKLITSSIDKAASNGQG